MDGQPLKFRLDGSVIPQAVRKSDRRGRPRSEQRDLYGTGGLNVGSEYSEEELEFMKAMDRYKRENQRPFPTWHEVMQVFLALGYRKVAPAQRKAEAKDQKTA